MIQKYDKNDCQAVKQLSGSARVLFEVIEKEEKGEMINVPGLCKALADDPKFVAFSCIHGDGKRESLEDSLGMVFEKALKAKMGDFINRLKTAGYRNQFLVIVDDTEPVRFWKWKTTQREVTTWLDMVIEDADIPSGWNVKLWSRLEASCIEQTHALPLYEKFFATQLGIVTQSVPYHTISN